MQEGTRRICLLDELRGFALLCMVVHHTFLDIGDIFGAQWGYDVFNALCVVQPVFWTIFIVISGICSRLSRNPAKRGALVLLCAGVITLVTAVLMPLVGFTGAAIWFGILHCLGCCMVITGLAMPLIRKIDYRVGAAVCALLFAVFYGIDGDHRTLLFGLVHLPDALYRSNAFAPLGFFNEHFASADYFSLLPWLFMFLFGAFVGQLAAEEKLPAWMYPQRSRFLSLVGRNSLWVYVLHQPVLYAALYLIYFLLSALAALTISRALSG